MKKLVFILDYHLTMNEYVSTIAQSCVFELCCLASIRRFVTIAVATTLIFAFVLSRIDYRNSTLFGSSHAEISHLQRIQISAA